MSYQVLARKWRPTQFEDVVGQSNTVDALTHALDTNRLHHAYLFTGTRGVGKTTLARIFAKCLNCENKVTSHACGECASCLEISEGRFIDLIEVDAASRTKVEDTRELLENVQYLPTRGRYKIYIIDEVHMLSNHSFNALLKTLEEPPSHVIFLLATTDPQKLPMTVLSRCLQFHLKNMMPRDIEQHFKYILEKESISFEPQALAYLAQAAQGSMRDGLSLLDQAIAHGQGQILTKKVLSMLGAISQDYAIDLLKAIQEKNGQKLYSLCEEITTFSPDYLLLLNELQHILLNIALLQTIPSIKLSNEIQSKDLNLLASTLSQEDVQLFYQIALTGMKDLSYASDLSNAFMMIMLRMMTFTPFNFETKNLTPNPKIPPHSPPTLPRNTLSNQTTPQNKLPTQHEKLNKDSFNETISSDIPTTLKNQTLSDKSLNASDCEVDWVSIYESASFTGMTLVLAKQCVLTKIHDQHFLLTVDKQQSPLLTDRNKKLLIDAIRAFYGKNIEVQINISEKESIDLIEKKIETSSPSPTGKNTKNDKNISAILKEFNAIIES
jgi:DNA polymerase III subunit gamma/tau